MNCPVCKAENLEGAIFCDACGANLAEGPAAASPVETASPVAAGVGKVKIHWKEPDQVTDLPDKPEVLIGREDPSSETFPDVDTTPLKGDELGVSRRHAKIARTPEGYTIEDLGSTNATYVNRKRIEKHVPVSVHPGDEIRLGKLGFTLEG